MSVDLAVQFMDDETSIGRVGDPAEQIEVQTGVAEDAKAGARFGIFEDLRMIVRDPNEDFHYDVDVRSVRDADGGVDPALIRMTIVTDLYVFDAGTIQQFNRA